MKSWRMVAVSLLCLALVGLMACSPFGGGEEETSQQLVEVVRGDLTVSVSGSGNIEVSNEVKLTFGSGGKVDKIYVEEGDNVAEDDVLAKLDTDALELALTQAQVALTTQHVALITAQVAVTQTQLALQTAEYNLEEAQEPYTEQDISNAEAAVVEAEYTLEFAQWWLERAALLRDKRDAQEGVYRAVTNLGIAERNLDEMLSAPDEDEIAVLEMGVEAAKQFLEQFQQSLELAEQSLEQFQQSVELAQKQLDEAIITAPFDGVVASVGVDEKDTVSATAIIVHLIDLTTMELKVEVDEIDIPGVKLGQRAIIEVDALPALELEGKVTSISSLGKEEAGVVLYEVKIGFAVPDGSGLRVGMSAEADIVINERNNVLLVPDRTIKQDSEGNSMVEVMVGKEVQERPVVIGISDGFQTEIVSGLDEGETVVIERRAKPKPTGMGCALAE